MDVGTGSALRRIQIRRSDMLPAAGAPYRMPPISAGCAARSGPPRLPQSDHARQIRQVALLRGGQQGVNRNLLPSRQRALVCSSSLAEGSAADSEGSLLDDSGGPLVRGEEGTEYNASSSSEAPPSRASASEEPASPPLSDSAHGAHQSSIPQTQADQVGQPSPSAAAPPATNPAIAFGLGLPEIAAGAVFAGGLAVFLAAPLRAKAPSLTAASQPPALVSVTGTAATSNANGTPSDAPTGPSTPSSGSGAGTSGGAGAQARHTTGSPPVEPPMQPPSLSPTEGALVRREPWQLARAPADTEKGLWDPEGASAALPSSRWHATGQPQEDPQAAPAQPGDRAALRGRRQEGVFGPEPRDGAPVIWELGPDGVPIRTSSEARAPWAFRGAPAEYLGPSAYPWGKAPDFPEYSSFSEYSDKRGHSDGAGYSDTYDARTGLRQGEEEEEEVQGDSFGSGGIGEGRASRGTESEGLKAQPGGGGAFVPAPVDSKGSLVSFKPPPQPQRGRGAWGFPGKQPKAGADSAVVVRAVVEDAQVQAVTALTMLKVLDADVDPAAICTRRQFARWMVRATGSLYSDPSKRILPAMFVEGVTDVAYDDVDHRDPDFDVIQGLAESGLIASKLSLRDLGCPRQRLLEQQQQQQLGGGRRAGGAVPQPRAPASVSEPAQQIGCNSGSLFRPDTALTRQDLISWKVVLDTSEQDVEDLLSLELSGLKVVDSFLDRGSINSDAKSAVALDLGRGRSSVFNTIFGLSRRFDPHKPVTCGQAALALTLGEAAASEAVEGELARMEMDEIAQAAVAEEEEEERREDEERAAAEAAHAAQAARDTQAAEPVRGSNVIPTGRKQAAGGGKQAEILTQLGDEVGGRGPVGSKGAAGGSTQRRARQPGAALAREEGGDFGKDFVLPALSLGRDAAARLAATGGRAASAVARACQAQLRQRLAPPAAGQQGVPRQPAEPAQQAPRAEPASAATARQEAAGQRDATSQSHENGRDAGRSLEGAEGSSLAGAEGTSLEAAEGVSTVGTVQHPSLRDNLAGALREFKARIGPALSELASSGINLLSVGGQWSAKAMVFVGGLLREGWLTVSSLRAPLVSWWLWAQVAVQRLKPKTRF